MQTEYLKTLMATVDEGSFSRAAELLQITQSAVSQRIKFLEEQLGHQLLDRSGQSLALTPAGEVVLAKAREILGKERELQDALGGLMEKQRLALCCTPTFGMAFLSKVLQEFITRHAELDDLKFVFLQPAEALRALRNGQFDLAVVEHCGGQDLSGLDRYPLPNDQLLFVVAPGKVPATEDGTIALDELTQFRLFARRDGCSSKELLLQLLRAQGTDLSIFSGVVVSDDLRFTIQSVMEGTGVAFVSRAVVSEFLANGKLAGYRLRGTEQTRGRSALLLPGRQNHPLLNDLLECIFQTVSPELRPQRVSGNEAVGETPSCGR